MRIFLDDVRAPPEGFRLCRTAQATLNLLKSGTVTFISFDHDLGIGPTGYDVASWIEKAVYEGRIRCPGWAVHSSNPVGRDNIVRAMQSAERFKTPQ